MAYLLSISFTAPFCYRKANFQSDTMKMIKSCKGMYTTRFACRGLINQVTRRSGIKHLLHKNSVGDLTSSNVKIHGSIQAFTRQCFEAGMCHSGACRSVHVLISGFWVGPEIEDGWGFVEASVVRVY